jgi:hypothetical protein
MKQTNIFQLISSILRETGTSCVLIGGFAVNYYKVTRQTADVDFLITKEDFEKTRGLFERAGYKQEFTQEIFARLNSTKGSLLDIDFMFIDKETLGEIIKSGKKINLAEEEFIIPCLNHLIALKLHSLKYNFKIREFKDLPDIIHLIRMNKVDYKSKTFRELCLKYGTKELYNRILHSV